MSQKAQIFQCIQKNNLRQVTLLLQGGCDVNATDSSGWTALMSTMVYVYNVDTRIGLLTQLIKAGADVNKTDNMKKCPLAYACILNQPESVSFLLKQGGINPNLPDCNGVTPLMHAAVLEHFEVIRVIMDHNRAGSVTIDMGTREEEGEMSLNISKSGKSQFSKKPGNNAISQKLLRSYSGDMLKSPMPGWGEEIELQEISKEIVDKGPSLSNNLRRGAGAVESDGTKRDYSNKTKAQEKQSNEDRDASIHRWAEDLKQKHETARRISTLTPPRPGPRKNRNRSVSLTERSSFQMVAPSHRMRPGSSQDKPIGGLGKSDHIPSSENDDEDDYSLESLSDLVGTVRQYAQEIREIYAPIQKDKEERIRQKNERNKRRKSKELNNKLTASMVSSLHPPPTQQEVLVEIHKADEVSKPESRKERPRSRPSAPAHSRSQEPKASAPVASLHMENEQQLSSTWPRGRMSPRSRERFHSAINHPAGQTSVPGSLRASTSSGTFSRPQIPADWNDGQSIQLERDILNKAYIRFNKNTEDPLLTAFNTKTNISGSEAPVLQKEFASSKQSLIQIAKNHKQARQQALPRISIIAAPTDPAQGLWDEANQWKEKKHEAFIHEDRMISQGKCYQDDSHRFSKNGGAGVKSSTKAGLRRRKSIDQGIEKY